MIDAGTCITFDLLLADGRYIGGNISPGLSMRLAAMHAHTARLPLVDAQGELPLLGLDTPHRPAQWTWCAALPMK